MNQTPLLSLRHLAVSYGKKEIFEDVTCHFYERDRICFIGQNGAGKSTLFKVLMQQIDPDEGEIYRSPGLSVGYLPQESKIESDDSVADYVRSFLTKNDVPSYVFDQYVDLLGAPREGCVQELSGGESRKLRLALALSLEPDILLLDEPTNHLDLETIQILENHLQTMNACVVIISHDRAFLEKTTNKTLWIFNKTIHRNEKGYGHFDAWQESYFAHLESTLNKVDKQLRIEERWLARGVTARRRRNQGRLRKLNDLRDKRKQLTHKPAQLKGKAMDDQFTSQVVIDVRDMSFGFDTKKPLIKDFSLRVLRGDRIGILGPNGCGKSTLIKLLMGQLRAHSGKIQTQKNMDIAYFDQRRDILDPELSILEALCGKFNDHITVNGQTRHGRGYLKDFLFDPANVDTKVSVLSGGEKNRLMLAKILAKPSGFMVLDEPTNDLDMDTLDLLLDILSDYPGTLIIVSHDRDFLDQLTTCIVSFEENGQVLEHTGGYWDYIKYRDKHFGQIDDQGKGQKYAQSAKSVKATKNSKNNEKADQTGVGAQKSGSKTKISFKHKFRFEQLPKEMEKIESEIEGFETLLSDPELFHKDPALFEKASKELPSKKDKLAALEDEWLELSEMFE